MNPHQRTIVIQLRSRLDEAMGEACVEKFLARYAAGEQRRKRFGELRQWILWLWAQSGWEGKKPSELLDFQENAKGRDKFVLLDFMMEHAQAKGGTIPSMIVRLSDLRGFFHHNRVELPPTGDWRPRPTRELTRGRLTMEQVVNIIRHSTIRDTAVFLTMLQGLMDLQRFTDFNGKYAEELTSHLQAGKLDVPFRVDFPNGRKKNPRAYYTFLYHDALKAWQEYFEKERGWPTPGEPCALDKDQGPLTRGAIKDSFDTVARRLKIKPPRQHDIGHRTGVAPHEAFRDVVRSRLQTARKKNFDTTCVEFWMGHSIDPYNYNKFTDLEPEYVFENAKIAAEYLNIISNSAGIAKDDLWNALKAAAQEDPEGLREFLKFTRNLSVNK